MKASGKFVLRIPPEWHEQFRQEAEAAQLSLNQLLLSRLHPTNPPQPKEYEIIKTEFAESLLGIVLFGSSVRGEAKSTSDIDLLLVLDHSVKIQRVLYSEWDQKILPTIGSKYSPQFTHLPQSLLELSSLWLEVGLEGEVLFDQNGLIRKTMKQIKQKIAEGQYCRKSVHGHPYWVRGENYAK